MTSKTTTLREAAQALLDEWRSPTMTHEQIAAKMSALRAALAVPAQGDDALEARWQPIKTAPQDGTHILVYWPRHPFDEDENMDESVDLGGVLTVTFRSGNGWCDPDYLDASGAWFGDDYCYAPEPTHWMLLPAPPTSLERAHD